ncbi:uncharacterized protein VP01_2438g5 [Puccinia sorghi]|uniref:Uncharacterized protein n=1 Tax=Puccinia sorghi TaxID=27349 RepID=A0A0L6V6Z8_9BASI|nr:uncharacterized protein VP01_2438g5 [Puccinia sorghi]
MGLLDEAKDLLHSSKKNHGHHEKGGERISGLDDSNSAGERNQSLGGNINTDDSKYAEGGTKYGQSDDYNKHGSGGTGARYNEDANVGLGCKLDISQYVGRDSTRGSQADSYGDSGFDRSQADYGSTRLSGQDDNASAGFGARGGVSAGGVGDSRDSVSSGGCGTNTQGDSFSRKNQTGFDNEFSSSGGY